MMLRTPDPEKIRRCTCRFTCARAPFVAGVPTTPRVIGASQTILTGSPFGSVAHGATPNPQKVLIRVFNNHSVWKADTATASRNGAAHVSLSYTIPFNRVADDHVSLSRYLAEATAQRQNPHSPPIFSTTSVRFTANRLAQKVVATTANPGTALPLETFDTNISTKKIEHHVFTCAPNRDSGSPGSFMGCVPRGAATICFLNLRNHRHGGFLEGFAHLDRGDYVLDEKTETVDSSNRVESLSMHELREGPKINWHSGLHGPTRMTPGSISALDGWDDVWETLSARRTTPGQPSSNIKNKSNLSDSKNDGIPNPLEDAPWGSPARSFSRRETRPAISDHHLTFHGLSGNIVFTVQVSTDSFHGAALSPILVLSARKIPLSMWNLSGLPGEDSPT